jgi:hypothetical protein
MLNTNNTTTGYINASVAVGFEALKGSNNPSNNIGTSNTAVGHATLQVNSTGSTNTAIGYVANISNTTGSYNAALGANTLQDNTTGGNNTAVGFGALSSNVGRRLWNVDWRLFHAVCQ